MTPPAPVLAVWQAAYARRPLTRVRCAEMVEKYDALAAVVALPGGAEQDAALRAAARRWPGSLREAQLAGPERCRERRAQAEVGAVAAERERAAWLAEAPALLLWADLHWLLADQLQWRGGGGVGEAGEFVAWLTGEARGRWPAAALLVEVAGPQVRPRQAYRWLAAQAGMPLVALNEALFGRSGPWDRRSGDLPGSA